ncbi:MAG: rod shape-determining protein RodA [Bacteroidales bacterium]|jgi:rod shape determining protein RodA|nr:rod shape-determining protein RodA [Bacteroidales bacterium]
MKQNISPHTPYSAHTIDKPLLFLYLFLVIVGWLSIFSSAYDPTRFHSIFTLSTVYGRQLVWIIAAFVIALIILVLDAKLFQHYAWVIYAGCLLLLLLVFVLGTEISGAKAWIKIGSFSIQPGEFMKLATALALARLLNQGKTVKEKRNVWIAVIAIVFLPILIIFLQHDTGSALVYTSFFILCYREGMSARIFIVTACMGLLGLITLYFNELYAIALLLMGYTVAWFVSKNVKNAVGRYSLILLLGIMFVLGTNTAYERVFQSHQKQRIDSLLGKTVDPKGADFNLNQSKIAIGSGGFSGKGFLKGSQTKFNFIPEQSTDFIFCSIGEEWGFLGALVVIGAFFFMIARILWLSEKHHNPFVRYYGYGIAGILFFHVAVNVGMTIGLVPIIGIPLPFLSYGGSSLWSFTSMIFIFIKLNIK